MPDQHFAYEGPGLAPLTPLPRLKRRRREQAVEAIKTWFFENFEDPVHHAPRDEGEFVFIHGGPYDTRDVIETMFSEDVSQETIELAIEEIEQEGGPNWGPSSGRIGEEPEDEEELTANPFGAAARHRAMMRRLVAVEEDLVSLSPREVGIGHNNPPVSVFDNEELRELRNAVALLKAQPVEPNVRVTLIVDAAGKLYAAGAKLLTYVSTQADAFITEASKAAGQESGKWLARVALYTVAADAALDWLRALLGF